MPKIFGHTVTRPAAIAIAGGSALAIWFAWKQHQGSGSQSPTALDPVTGLPYSQDSQTDPLTGMTYLAEAQQYGSVSAAEQAVAGEASVDFSSAAGSGGGGGGGQSLVPASTVQGTAYASNSAWAQAAQGGLTDIGYTSTDVAEALGAYLGSKPLTPAQAAIVQAAVAEYGPPPVGTFTITLAPATGPTGSGAGGGGASPPAGGIPGLGGGGAGTSPPPAAAGRLPAPSGITLTDRGKTGVGLKWDPVSGASGYFCEAKAGGSNGTLVNGPFFVTSPDCNFGQLKAATKYTALIWPSDSADPGGPASGQPHTEFAFSTTS